MGCFAVIGLGSIALRHLKNLRILHPDAKIYAVSASGKNQNVPESVDAILDVASLILLQPEYVIIASPAPFHAQTAYQLIKSGIPVLVEKPVTADYESASELARCSQAYPKTKIAVGYCLRFLPSAIAVKNFLQSNALGKIYNVSSTVGQYLPSWRKDKHFLESVSARKELGGGAILELSHEIDLLFWLFGDLELKYSWLRKNVELGLDVEEIADLVLVSKTDIYITVHLDFLQKKPLRQCEILGEKGRIVWDLILNSVVLIDAEGSKTIYIEPTYDKNNMYLDMLRAFEMMNQSLVSDLATLNSSLNVMKLVDDSKRSSQSGAMN